MLVWSLVCFAFFSYAGFASSVEIDVSPEQKTFSVQLPANPTTGYRWRVGSLDDRYLEKVSEKYLPALPKRIGSGGQVCFTFAKKKLSQRVDETTIVLKYQRPWEEKPIDVKTIVVRFNIKRND